MEFMIQWFWAVKWLTYSVIGLIAVSAIAITVSVFT